MRVPHLCLPLAEVGLRTPAATAHSSRNPPSRVRDEFAPGVVEEGTEYYSVEGANRVRAVLPTFEGGDAIVGVLGNFFKCPAAPFETAIRE